MQVNHLVRDGPIWVHVLLILFLFGKSLPHLSTPIANLKIDYSHLEAVNSHCATVHCTHVGLGAAILGDESGCR
jgi:hypothetical protein